MNICMNGESEREHCFKMMSHISCAAVMEAKLEQEMHINMILKSLHDSFNQFKMTYNMNKLKLTHTELMHKLMSIEQSLMKQENDYQTENCSKLKRNLRMGKRTKRIRESFWLPNQFQ